jgi:hypothetical protein
LGWRHKVAMKIGASTKLTMPVMKGRFALIVIMAPPASAIDARNPALLVFAHASGKEGKQGRIPDGKADDDRDHQDIGELGNAV